jgi:predicted glycosyltransferase involved in capsule biosynthesis
MLSERLTQSFLRKKRSRISPFTPGITLRSYSFHSNLLSKYFIYESTDWYDTQSANLSVWKKDFIHVNGFNEEFEGWGREDSELALRLIRSGLKKLELRFCAVTFHLAHGKDNKHTYVQATEKNQKLLDSIAASSVLRCKHGIADHL